MLYVDKKPISVFRHTDFTHLSSNFRYFKEIDIATILFENCASEPNNDAVLVLETRLFREDLTDGGKEQDVSVFIGDSIDVEEIGQRHRVRVSCDEVRASTPDGRTAATPHSQNGSMNYSDELGQCQSGTKFPNNGTQYQ